MYARLRPIRSDSVDQPRRPERFASESRPTKPAAACGVTEEKKSWIIGEACSRIPMPAVTFVNSTIHSRENCGVRIARVAVTSPLAWVEIALADGVQPAGFQPGAGTRTTIAPRVMITA